VAQVRSGVVAHAGAAAQATQMGAGRRCRHSRGETDKERRLRVGELDEQRAAWEPHGSHVQGSRARRGHVGESRHVLWQSSAFLA
jgi:hypothetical protein